MSKIGEIIEELEQIISEEEKATAKLTLDNGETVETEAEGSDDDIKKQYQVGQQISVGRNGMNKQAKIKSVQVTRTVGESLEDVAKTYGIDSQEFNKNHKWNSYKEIPMEWQEFIEDSSATFVDVRDFFERHGFFVDVVDSGIQSAYIFFKVVNDTYKNRDAKSTGVMNITRADLVTMNYKEVADKILKEIKDRYPELLAKGIKESLEDKLGNDPVLVRRAKELGYDKMSKEELQKEYKKGYKNRRVMGQNVDLVDNQILHKLLKEDFDERPTIKPEHLGYGQQYIVNDSFRSYKFLGLQDNLAWFKDYQENKVSFPLDSEFKRPWNYFSDKRPTQALPNYRLEPNKAKANNLRREYIQAHDREYQESLSEGVYYETQSIPTIKHQSMNETEATIGQLEDNGSPVTKLIHAAQLVSYDFTDKARKMTPTELLEYLENRVKRTQNNYVKDRLAGAIKMVKEFLGMDEGGLFTKGIKSRGEELEFLNP